VILVPAAVGPAEGTVTIHQADASQIATCSTEWLEAVKSSGRFGRHGWGEPVEVPMTTLDKLIAEHGRPAFCKIDVEGFELDVLLGLSTPIPVMSFEFSPETIERACQCVKRITQLAGGEDRARFNYCAHGHLTYGLPEPAAAAPFQQAFRQLPPQAMKFGGDVYAWSQV
jgi:FkbM family methyltransferase